MAKNFASIHANTGDSSSLNQSVYVKKETTRGMMIAPVGTDFIFTLAGGSLAFSQPNSPSAHRSGRHNNNTILEKKSLEWSMPTYVNIDTGVAAGATEVETGLQVLWESLLGRRRVSPDVASGVVFDSANDPSITFSVFEVGDKWAKQAYGCFVDACEVSLPGDGQSQLNWSGMGVESFLVGVGKSIVTNAGGNTVTLGTGEGKKFPVGSLVMIVKADGTTRSTDTAAARKVTAVAGDVVSLDGAALTSDSDGSAPSPVYLAYWEPATKTGIDNPQTGLVGTFTSSSIPGNPCVRSATITISNNHEVVDYCWGEDKLSGSIFVPASRLEVAVSIEMNLNADLVAFYNDVQALEAQDLNFVLGSSTSRHLEIDLPKVIFQVPSIEVPENGSIPVSFEGVAYQTALDAADEVTISYV